MCFRDHESSVVANDAKFLDRATGADMRDKGCVVRKQVIRVEIQAATLVELQAETLTLYPLVGEPVDGSPVLGLELFAGGAPGRSGGGGGGDTGGRIEGSKKPGSILGPLQVLF